MNGNESEIPPNNPKFENKNISLIFENETIVESIHNRITTSYRSRGRYCM